MGAKGEQALVNKANSETIHNAKLHVCIVRALALSDIGSASIDFVIEVLFKAAR